MVSGKPDSWWGSRRGADRYPQCLDRSTVSQASVGHVRRVWPCLARGLLWSQVMTNITFDPSLYTRPPLFTLLGGITLAEALYAACPKEMPPTVKKAAQKMERARLVAQAAWSERQRLLGPSTTEEAKNLGNVYIRGWAAIRSRLQAYASLPVEEYPRAARAAELVAVLFPEGLEFTQRSYVEQLAATDALLQRIADDKLEKDLSALCGPEFLTNVQRQLPRYRTMVQSNLARAAESANLALHLKGLSQIIAEYATKVAATVDSDDELSYRRAMAALAPIDSYRDASARRSGGPSPMPEPTPSPVAPAPVAPAPAPAVG
jgi:hypothetical protein